MSNGIRCNQNWIFSVAMHEVTKQVAILLRVDGDGYFIEFGHGDLFPVFRRANTTYTPEFLLS